MAELGEVFKAAIHFILKGKNVPKEAQDGLDKTAKAADKTKKKMNALGKSAQGVKTQIAGLIGGAVLARFAGQSIQAFAQVERSLSAVGKQLESFGLNAEQGLPRVEGYLEQLESTSGVLMNEATPAFQKFLGITKDVDGAMYATSLAADLTNAGLGDMRTNSERLANLLQGEVTEAAKSLGLQLRDSNGAIKTQAQLMEELEGLYGGFSATNQDAQADMDSLSATFAQIGRDIGEGLAPVLKLIGWLVKGAVRGIKSFGAVIGNVVSFGIGAFQSLSNVIKEVFNFKKLFSNPGKYFADLTKVAIDEGKKMAREVADTHATLGEDLKDIWAKEQRDFADKEQGKAAVMDVALSKQREQEVREANRRAQQVLQAELSMMEAGTKAKLDKELELLEMRRAQAVEAAKQQGKEVASIHAQFDAQRKAKVFQHDKAIADANRASQSALLQAQIESADQYSQHRLDLELQYLEQQRDQAVEAAEKMGADTQAINDAFDIARQEKLHQFNVEKAQIERDAFIARKEAESELEIAALQDRLTRVAADSQAAFDIQMDILDEQTQAELEAMAEKALAERELLEEQGLETNEVMKKLELEQAAVKQKAETAKAQMVSERVRAEREQHLALAQEVIGTLTSIFGQNKAFAIAGAIISTYRGVARALELPPPQSYVFAALTAAKGLAEVIKIKKTKPVGKGFDDPTHDRLAMMGGRRWAEDMVNLVGTGFRSGLKDWIDSGPRGGIPEYVPIPGGDSIDQRQTTMNLSTLMLGRAGLRRLRRLLREAEIDDEARAVQ